MCLFSCLSFLENFLYECWFSLKLWGRLPDTTKLLPNCSLRTDLHSLHIYLQAQSPLWGKRQNTWKQRHFFQGNNLLFYHGNSCTFLKSKIHTTKGIACSETLQAFALLARAMCYNPLLSPCQGLIRSASHQSGAPLQMSGLSVLITLWKGCWGGCRAKKYVVIEIYFFPQPSLFQVKYKILPFIVI